MRSLLGVLSVLALASCTTDAAPESDAMAAKVVRLEVPLGTNGAIDVLFVIDNSAAMAGLQETLASSYRTLIDTIVTTSYGEAPDLHVAVITTDSAALREQRYLSDIPQFGWQRLRNYSGTLPDNFVQLASVGAAGGPARPLDVLRASLTSPTSAGFLREHAALAIVVVTSGDDQSTASVAEVAASVRQLKADPARIFVGAALACAPDASPRLRAFLEQFPGRAADVAICAADLRPIVAPIADQLKVTLGAPCITTPLAEPRACSAVLVDPASAQQLALPACSDAVTTHCYAVREDAAACPTPPYLMVKTSRTLFPATMILECVAP